MWKRWQSLSGWSWLRGARVAALSAAAGLVALSLAGGLEEDYALRALFHVREAAPPPADVVVVAITGRPRVVRIMQVAKP